MRRIHTSVSLISCCLLLVKSDKIPLSRQQGASNLENHSTEHRPVFRPTKNDDHGSSDHGDGTDDHVSDQQRQTSDTEEPNQQLVLPNPINCLHSQYTRQLSTTVNNILTFNQKYLLQFFFHEV